MSIADLYESLPYGPAPEGADLSLEWLDSHDRKFGHFIGGEFQDGERLFEVFNPATAVQIAQVSQAGANDIDRAVEAARQAQPGWQSLGGHGRARILYAIARQIQKHSRLLAFLESIVNG
jgi:aldehyde dehydrogenase (NAD+)